MNFKDQNTKTMKTMMGMEQIFKMKTSMCLLIVFLLFGATSCQKEELLIPKVKDEIQTAKTFDNESDENEPNGSGSNKMDGDEEEGEGSGNEGNGGSGDDDDSEVTDKDGCDCDEDDDSDDAGFVSESNAIVKGEESVRTQKRPLGLVARLLDRLLQGVHAAHLTGARTE